MENYKNYLPYSQDDLAKIGRMLEERRCWLAARGIKFFVLLVPNKKTIYSEYLPRATLGQSRLDQLVQYLSKYPDLEIIDVRSTILAAKKVRLTYRLTDSHWTGWGAFVAARELMQRIKKYFPAVSVPDENEYLVFPVVENSGDLSAMLFLKEILQEEVIWLWPKKESRAKNGTRDYPASITVPGTKLIVQETGDKRLPRALMFNDSFGDSLPPYISPSFQSAIYVHNFVFLPELIVKEKPDVVILECVERNLDAHMVENPETVRVECKNAGK